MSDELGADERAAYEMEEYLNEKAEEFDSLAAERHQAGAEEYGPVSFLENDVIRMMLEELADVTNYCRMQGVKLLMLQEQLEQKLTASFITSDPPPEKIEMGFQSFRGTKDVGWTK